MDLFSFLAFFPEVTSSSVEVSLSSWTIKELYKLWVCGGRMQDRKGITFRRRLWRRYVIIKLRWAKLVRDWKYSKLIRCCSSCGDEARSRSFRGIARTCDRVGHLIIGFPVFWCHTGGSMKKSRIRPEIRTICGILPGCRFSRWPSSWSIWSILLVIWATSWGWLRRWTCWGSK